MKKKLPALKSDKAAEDFVAKVDLTEYDLAEMKTVRFEFQPKTERVNMRLPPELLKAVRAAPLVALERVAKAKRSDTVPDTWGKR